MFDLEFAYAYGTPPGHADFRVALDDFIVDEDLGFTPEGQGEHVYVQVQKRGVNTEWLAKQLARFAEVKLVDIGYCGMKDRHAKTTQWFSIYKPKGELRPWNTFADFVADDVAILQCGRGGKKLRRGQHLANDFQLCLKAITVPQQVVESRLQQIRATGVPNYFGEQRFGHQRQNLAAAAAWLNDMRGHNPGANRGIWMSAMRSYIFNWVLHQRILQNPSLPEDIRHLTGPLWGRGRLSGEQADWELSHLTEFGGILHGLEHCGMNQERRALWLQPANLSWKWLADDCLQLDFRLPPGEYATSVLRELLVLTDRSLRTLSASL